VTHAGSVASSVNLRIACGAASIETASPSSATLLYKVLIPARYLAPWASILRRA